MAKTDAPAREARDFCVLEDPLAIRPPDRFQELVTLLNQEFEREQQEGTILREENMRLRSQLSSYNMRRSGFRPSCSSLASEDFSMPATLDSRQDITEDQASEAVVLADLGSAERERRCTGMDKFSSMKKGNAYLLKSYWKLSPAVLSDAAWGEDIDRTLSNRHAIVQPRMSQMEFEKCNEDIEHPAERQCIIHSTSTGRFIWDIIGLVLITYDMIMIPMMVFEMPRSTAILVMDWLTLLFWTGDMIQSCFLDYYDKGVLVTSHVLILKRYLRSWFVVDLLVVGPDWVMSVLDSGGTGQLVGVGRVLRAARAVRMLRLLRLLKLQRILNILYDMIDSEYTFIVLDLCRLLLFILMLNHVIACLWFLVGTLGRTSYRRNWIEHAGDTPVLPEGLMWQYTTSLHWSLTQFTPASMDVSATNVPERIFSIIVLFFALVAFGTIVGSVTGSMTALRNMKGDSVKQFWMLRRYMKQKGVCPELKERIVKFLEYVENQKLTQVQQTSVKILKDLSQPLRNELTHGMYMPALIAHPFWEYANRNMPCIGFRICTEALTEVTYAFNDVIFYPGDEAQAMFFINSGSFVFELNSEEWRQSREDVEDGVDTERYIVSHWISEAVLWTHWRHRGALRCHTPGDLLSMSPASFAKVISIHPRPWYLARNYATIFLQEMNADKLTAGLTDLHCISRLHDKAAGAMATLMDCDDYNANAETSTAVSVIAPPAEVVAYRLGFESDETTSVAL